MRVSVPRCINEMLKPRPPWNPIWIKPIRFHLEKLLVKPLFLFSRVSTGSTAALYSLSQVVSCSLKVPDPLVKFFQFQVARIDFVPYLQLGQEMVQRYGINPKVIGQQIRIGQS